MWLLDELIPPYFPYHQYFREKNDLICIQCELNQNIIPNQCFSKSTAFPVLVTILACCVFYSVHKTSLIHLYRNPVLSLRPHAIYIINSSTKSSSRLGYHLQVHVGTTPTDCVISARFCFETIYLFTRSGRSSVCHHLTVPANSKRV